MSCSTTAGQVDMWRSKGDARLSQSALPSSRQWIGVDRLINHSAWKRNARVCGVPTSSFLHIPTDPPSQTPQPKHASRGWH